MQRVMKKFDPGKFRSTLGSAVGPHTTPHLKKREIGNGESMLKDRRESQRKPVLIRTRLEYDGTVREAFATDISERGVFCRLDEPLAVGTPVLVSVDGDGGVIQVRSQVARIEDRQIRGVGLSWSEEPMQFLDRCFRGPAANVDTRNGSTRPNRVQAGAFQPLGAVENDWKAGLEAHGDSGFEMDPFAQIDERRRMAEMRARSAAPTRPRSPSPTRDWRVDAIEQLVGRPADVRPSTETGGGVLDWSTLLPGGENRDPESAGHAFKSGTPVRFRISGRWISGRVKAVEGNSLQVASAGTLPVPGHVIQLSGATTRGSSFQVHEASLVVERVLGNGAFTGAGGLFFGRIVVR